MESTMKKLIIQISNTMEKAFEEAGYDAKYGKVTLSNRPDLCEFQCNGSMAAAKAYKKAPIQIANEVLEKVDASDFEQIEAVMPGFINIKLKTSFLAQYMNEMMQEEAFGCEKPEKKQTIMVDYGGPNIAKPLHVGHLRSSIIGESIKRMGRFMGHEVIGDAHLGDWGLQMGLIITEMKKRQPELVYFDETYTGEYPSEPPFTMSDLEEIYPTASGKSKEDPEYKAEALQATVLLQQGNRGYQALWNHILNVSIADLKASYERLDVTFDLWKKESDVQKYVPDMVADMKAKGHAYVSEGAVVVDVQEESDAKELPPCIILKSDGASLYSTTDLATILERVQMYHPDRIIYVADKRQDLHFKQVFRCAKKTGLAPADMKLDFLGFGTMNGKDGKPFKTRQGGVMRLEHLIGSINEEMFKKITENHTVDPEEAKKTAEIVGLSAIKYGDLSNQASKDYIFDIDKFTSFEGNTGPYILYTIVRIKSILKKHAEQGGALEGLQVMDVDNVSAKALMLVLAQFNGVIENAFEETAPHKVCAYIYELANSFNRFYHETKILGEEDADKKNAYLALLCLTKDVLNTCIDVLGFDAPERM